MNKKIKTNSNSEIYKIFKNSQKFSIKWTSYFQVYDQIFKKYKNKKITFVEVGAANGGSLFIWKKYFSKKSRIIGIDLNPEAKKLRKHGFEIYNLIAEIYEDLGNNELSKKFLSLDSKTSNSKFFKR